MKKVTLKWLAWLFSAALVGVAVVQGRHVPFAEQWPLYEALRTTASIIFAVVGAWLAIIYPDRLKLSFQQTTTKASSTNGGMSRLFTPIVHSTTILCIILLLGIIAPLIKRVDLLQDHLAILRGCSYGVLTALTLWQLWTVILSFVPADIVKSHVDHEDRRHRTVEGYKRSENYVPRGKGDEL